MGVFDFVNARRAGRMGRPRNDPGRETKEYPNLIQVGRVNQTQGLVYKPTPRNLRYFSRTPFPRRAINAIKNPIKMMEWDIVPIDGIEWNSLLKQQAEIAKNCFAHPNKVDDFQSMLEQFLEDYLIGAGSIETQIGGDANHPLYMFPVDGLSIQIYAEWEGQDNSPRYAQTMGYGSEFGGGEYITLLDSELLYLRPNPNTSTPFGYGPIEIAFNTISRLLSTGKFAGNVAGNMRPSIGLDFPGLPPADLERMRAFWKNDVEGMGQVPMFASAMNPDGKAQGMDVLRFYPEGDRGLFLEYQVMLQRELATAFDLSPQNFGIERDVNRDTAEVARDRDWDQVIRPTAHDVAKAFTRHCLHKALGFSQLRFKFVEAEKQDEMASARIFDLLYKANATTPNLIREELGQDPLDSPWADRLFIDTQIALWAARGAKQILDPEITEGISKPAPPEKPTSGKKG